MGIALVHEVEGIGYRRNVAFHHLELDIVLCSHLLCFCLSKSSLSEKRADEYAVSLVPASPQHIDVEQH